MRDIIQLLEAKSKPKDLEVIKLNFTDREVSSVLSKNTLDLHYGKLAHAYATRYNNGEGDPDFNYAGLFLHNILFTQYREARNNNKPNGPIEQFINKHFKSYDGLKGATEEAAMQLQGSGWVYLAYDGSIKTIKNHEVRNDILILVDLWEHAYILDYGSDKKDYLSKQWKIINWNVINTRWGQSL